MLVTLDVSQAVFGTGVSDYTINLVNSLPQDCYNLVGFSLRRLGDLKNLFPTAKVYPIPPTFSHTLWNKWHILPIEIFSPKTPIFHSSDWTQPPSSSQKVTTVHDLTPFLLPQETLPQVVAVHTARMSWVVKECRKIICVSQSTASDMSRLFPQTTDRLAVIPEALPSRFMIPPSPSPYLDYIFAIGSPQPRKNISTLITAYKKYKHKLRLPEKLIIAGENFLADPDPSIIFTGYISTLKLVSLLAGATVFVYPSSYEGFGLPILEAFYHQVPVVCANSSSLPEVAGQAAVLIHPKDPEDLAHGISQAIKNKSDLITRGKKQLSLFSWQKTADLTLELYRSLL